MKRLRLLWNALLGHPIIYGVKYKFNPTLLPGRKPFVANVTVDASYPVDSIESLHSLLGEGNVVEVSKREGGGLVLATKPVGRDDISCTPTLVSDSEDTLCRIQVMKPGEEPVDILTVRIPRGYFITGIKGARQEERSRERDR